MKENLIGILTYYNSLVYFVLIALVMTFEKKKNHFLKNILIKRIAN